MIYFLFGQSRDHERQAYLPPQTIFFEDDNSLYNIIDILNIAYYYCQLLLLSYIKIQPHGIGDVTFNVALKKNDGIFCLIAHFSLLVKRMYCAINDVLEK